MQAAPDKPSVRHLLYLWGIVFTYFAINALLQFLVSRTADLDQAEQLLLSQTFQLGYSAQPPLYTYLTQIIFAITGPDLSSLLGLKVVLLSLLVGSLIRVGDQFGFSMRQHLIVVVSMVFIPQLIWESQRDLTHSVLATAIAAATLFQAVRTQRSSALHDYIVLGVLIGIGSISKYNYVIFLSALVIAIVFTSTFRSLLMNRHAILAMIVAIIIAAPHLAWVVSNYETAASSVHKLGAGEGGYVTGLARAALSALAFLTPLWIFSALLIGRGIQGSSLPEQAGDRKLITNLLIATLTIVALFVLATGAQQIKDRWYQPLLFYVPLIIALYAEPKRTRINVYYMLGIIFAALVSVALSSRTIFADRFGHYSRPNLPYPDLMESLAMLSEKPEIILAESNLLGGNARPYFPRARIIVPTYNSNPVVKSGAGLILCETDRCDGRKFRDWARYEYGIDFNSINLTKIEKPYYYAPAHAQAVYFATIHLSPSYHQ